MNSQGALRIAVEGVIGVGKTTLAQAIAEHLGAVRLMEEQIDNPFLELFYKQPKRYALPCQLAFLEGRLQQFNQLVPVGVPVVTDHSLIKDPLFAAVNLDGQELALYQRFFARCQQHVSFKPDVIIYLSAKVEEIGKRIRNRGRRMEVGIDVKYLHQLVESFERYFDGPEAAKQRVIVVKADGNNIAADPAAVERLVAAAVSAPRGMSYCNPES